jgi:nitrilase
MLMGGMRVAAIQMTSTPDVSQNLEEAHRLLLEAVDRGAEFVSFPENFSILTDDPAEYLKAAESKRGGMVVETLQEWAAEYDIWLLGGSLPLKAPKKADQSAQITNSSLLVSPEGEITARYDKIHLFDVNLTGDRAYRESETFRAGKKCVTAETKWGRVGLSVCYDLRFPELYRALSEQGADMVFIPSAFTAFTGKAHWDALTRARAIENQVYVIAPAQTGSPYPGRTTHGHTRIIDPWGRIMAERPAGPGVVMAELDFTELARIRRELPALTHRRL